MNCFICNKKSWKTIYKKLVKCRSCGFVRAKDSYFAIESKKIYTDEYFNGLDYIDYQNEKIALVKNFQNRLKTILKYKHSGVLLEIGCAYGYFLAIARQHFRTLGIDLDKIVTAKAQKNTPSSDIKTGDFANLLLPSTSVDVICMFDVIEHLREPQKYLEKSLAILKPGGIIAIETGDISAFLPQIQRDKWRLIIPPIHLNYFDKKTLTRLLTNNGFKVLKIEYPSFYRTVKQTAYKLQKGSLIYKALTPFFNIAYPLNTKDLMFVIAQKPHKVRAQSK